MTKIKITEQMKVNLSLKTIVSFLVAIIFYVLSIAGVYYTLKSDIKILGINLENYKKEIELLKIELKESNLEVLNYKVDLILEKLE